LRRSAHSRSRTSTTSSSATVRGWSPIYLSISNVAQLSRDDHEQLRRELFGALPDTAFRLALTANLWRAARLLDSDAG
jgi:hypothetical protein